MMHLLLGEARAAFFGPSLNLEPHTNAVSTIAIALGSPMQLRILDKRGLWTDFEDKEVAIIPGGVLHHLRASPQARILFIYLDPRQDFLEQLSEAQLSRGRAAFLLEDLSQPTMKQVERCFELGTRFFFSSKINRVLDALEDQPAIFHTLEDASKLTNLSSSRFRALFMQQVGIPFRRYRLWRKMANVVSNVYSGKNLTEAALDAGFSDSAHLSASFKAMFGIQPSILLDPRLRIDISAREKVSAQSKAQQNDCSPVHPDNL